MAHRRRCALLSAHLDSSASPIKPAQQHGVVPADAASFASGLFAGLVGGAAAAAVALRVGKQQPQETGAMAPIPQASAETFGVPMGPDGEMYQVPVSMPRVGQSTGAYEYTRAMLDDGIHNTRTLGHSTMLEETFAERFEHKYGILYANGTATLHGALLGCGVGVGDEVIVPSFTPFPTGAAVLYCNAVPVVVDVDPDTWTMDPVAVAAAITPRTKAIIPVMINGHPAHIDELMALAKEHDLAVIEDCAQCYLAYYKGKVVGSFGDFASWSFQGSKHVTCGDGGILCSSNKEMATRARKACVFGFKTAGVEPGNSSVRLSKEVRSMPDFKRHDTIDCWFNYRLPEIAAAVALGEFERMDDLVAMRTAVGLAFMESLKGCRWLRPQKVLEGCVSSWYTVGILIERPDVEWLEFRRKFVDMGGDGFYAPPSPLHREPVFDELVRSVEADPERYPHWAGRLPSYADGTCPVWERMQPHVMLLKTNYFDVERYTAQAKALKDTIEWFEADRGSYDPDAPREDGGPMAARGTLV